MKELMYEDWYKKRLQKIKDIFGEEWFFNKKVLEIACSFGEIGVNLLKLGADVTFTDIDKRCIDSIRERLEDLKHTPDAFVLDQNEDYNLDRQFDLVLHLGSLYVLKDWKKNLETVMSHTNTMVLETIVSPNGEPGKLLIDYTEEDVENHLRSIGCRFIKIIDSKLNSNGIYGQDLKAKQLYDWDKRQFIGYDYSELVKNKTVLIPRRMWLVLK
jgi:2-polyprenyl-3-methyl-5-hydroxy-6-metoxy-1,4-benzoquinol methylase